MSNPMRVKDEDGNIYPSLRECLRSLGCVHPSGGAWQRLQKKGYIFYKGQRITYADKTETIKLKSKDENLINRLKQRYTEKELEMLSKGEGLRDRFVPYPEIHLEGEHHRILVMSDTHIGSHYSPKEWHDIVADYANNPDNEIECILHCGDLVEGMKIGRMGTQIYELSEIGYVAQRDEAIRLMSKYQKPIYVISGNHDRFFVDNFGCDIVEDVCKAVPNMTKVGDDQADITIGGCKIRIFHGGDGSSYALSYSLQKCVEAMAGGNKPHIFIRGHIHKYVSIFTRNVYALSCPAMEKQTSFMAGKKLEAHTGFLVIDFDTKEGSLCNVSVQLFPFYA